MEKKVKLGILGFGNMGSTHAGNIKAGKCPEIEITAICDCNKDRLAFWLALIHFCFCVN